MEKGEWMWTNIYNFLSPIPMQHLPETEMLVRGQATAYPKPAAMTPLQRETLVATGAPAGAYLQIPYKAATPLWRVQQMEEGRGTGREYVSDLDWGGPIWGPGMPGHYSDPRAYDLYWVWRDMQPASADTSPSAFVAMLESQADTYSQAMARFR